MRHHSSSSPATRRQLARRARLLEDRARQMRASPTFAEQKLWQGALCGGKLGVAFRRQVPLIGRYVADFAAPSLKLVIEVDGDHHIRRQPADARRDERLRRTGWRVVRVPEALVRRDFAAARELVIAAIAQCRSER